MSRKILIPVLFGILLVLIAGCGPKSSNVKLFTSNATATITFQESMTLYKTMDVKGPVLGKVNAGEYKVYEAVNAKDEGTWVKIEANGEKGWVLGFIVKGN
jgi:hypothetical protein